MVHVVTRAIKCDNITLAKHVYNTMTFPSLRMCITLLTQNKYQLGHDNDNLHYVFFLLNKLISLMFMWPTIRGKKKRANIIRACFDSQVAYLIPQIVQYELHQNTHLKRNFNKLILVFRWHIYLLSSSKTKLSIELTVKPTQVASWVERMFRFRPSEWYETSPMSFLFDIFQQFTFVIKQKRTT